MVSLSKGKTPCCYCRNGEDDVGVGSNPPDLEGVSVAIILPGSDRPITAARGGRQTAAMVAIAGGGDGSNGAPNSGAPAVHELR
ncbi:hypothetical protein ACLOJK_034543, partial [Asimina triloba]